MIRRANALPQDRYTTISNAWLRDERLSWKARGLLAHLASHSLNWETSLERLSVSGPDGRDAVRSGLNELERFGYLVRVRARNDDGTLAGVDVELVDPWISPTSENPTQADPTKAEPTPKKNKLEEDHQEEDQYTPSRLKQRATHDEVTADFDDFWTRYPRRVAKGQALKAYRAARKKTDHETIIKAVTRYPFDRERPQFIPHPATWLNGERWNDETATNSAGDHIHDQRALWDAGRLYA